MTERLALQIAVAVASLVPVLAGAAGIVLGPAMIGTGLAGSLDLDSHYSYLSGLLFAIGLGYLSAVPHIERHGARFGLLTCLVVTGGLARLVSLFAEGRPSLAMMLTFGMELMVAPGLALWQRRFAARSQRDRSNP